MIELPRAALRADEISEVADFFSFGTNDLTRTALGMSRDDAEGKFLTFYLEEGVVERNPFETLDQGGVGELMRIGVERGRGAKEGLKIGICGEHGGDPDATHVQVRRLSTWSWLTGGAMVPREHFLDEPLRSVAAALPAEQEEHER